jgi:predicted nucleic acid-binding protein
MSLYVVDASAAIKWILPEPAWDDALRIAPRPVDPAGFPLLDASLLSRKSLPKRAQRRESAAGCPLVPP